MANKKKPKRNQQEANGGDLLERLSRVSWGLSQASQDKLLKKMQGLVTGEQTSDRTRVEAFRAILEAQKIEVGVVKLILDKALADHLMADGDKGVDTIPIGELDLTLEEEVKLLDKLREQKTRRRIVG